MSRALDEIADELLDAQEEWRKVMRECDDKIHAATKKLQDTLISATDEAGLVDADLDAWPRGELVWQDPGDLSVQFKEAAARKREGR